jgi:hypothetical protein
MYSEVCLKRCFNNTILFTWSLEERHSEISLYVCLLVGLLVCWLDGRSVPIFLPNVFFSAVCGRIDLKFRSIFSFFSSSSFSSTPPSPPSLQNSNLFVFIRQNNILGGRSRKRQAYALNLADCYFQFFAFLLDANYSNK